MTTIYEDQAITINLPRKATKNGHITLTTKKNVMYLSELEPEETTHLFRAASISASAVFEGLGAQGTNILVNEGEEPLTIHVLPRNFEDGINIFWEPSRANDQELQQIADKIKDKLWYVGKQTEETTPQTTEQPIHEEKKPPEKNYKLQHLNKSP